jgi:hypothetical protein
VGADEDFFYTIAEGEEDDYLHIDCEIPVSKNQTRVYEISYCMEIGNNDIQDGMLLDVIGYGWGVALHNVAVNVTFPDAITLNDYKIYSGGYGAKGNDANVLSSLSEDGSFR